MELNIIFDYEAEETIVYDLNKVYITTNSPDRIEALLINEQLKLSNLEFRKTYYNETDEFPEEYNFEEEKADNQEIINFIKKTIDKSLTLEDFIQF